jgi:hypothetical protein
LFQQETGLNLKGILYHYRVRNIPICGVSVATMIHKYGLLICSKILKFNGYITSEALTLVYPSSKPIGSQKTLFYLSVGVLQFLVFGLMSLKADDQGAKIANRMTAIVGLIEALVIPNQSLRLSGLGVSMGIILAFIYLAYEAKRNTSVSA